MSMKVPAIVEEAKKALAQQDMAVVIGLQTTGEVGAYPLHTCTCLYMSIDVICKLCMCVYNVEFFFL